MPDRQTRRVVIMLLFVSALLYACQILIFHEPRTTFFYLFQDFAFLPATVAIATVVVGQILNERERLERMEKTRMLTSAFFSEMGGQLMGTLLTMAEREDRLMDLLMENREGKLPLPEVQKELQGIHLSVTADEASFQSVKTLILEHRTALLVLSSNPMLLENECFTELLWAIFHLTDEFRLRGDFADLDEGNRAHLNQDMERVLNLLLLNWVGNVRYLKKQYPSFFVTVEERLSQDGNHGA